ncbi:OmpW family protein [Chromobacterium sp. IIBBL 290-4]|uniref:OmpW/AlkL family protein n=1 Tax=Chromobacterium sp. IIBBL 290-4 TaxID=2953890 RepID=UPI0020B708DF|nr:OmpW family outer membrane protein [Chromobacterium sp. IIBBL 290-4]UTH76491.1 outer membrane beta-barrel protein [Chromobacterium sp. IIBBL 290-4]
MKKLALAAMIGMISASAFAAQGDILARFRLIDVDPSASWSNSGALPGLSVDAKSSVAPELDFTYMITNNIGAELILGTSRHKITANGADIGKVSVLPPTVTLQYHFAPEATFRPYVGAGLNYTRFYDNGLNAGGSTPLNVKNNSFGPALQAGADIAINKSWFFNVDVKKLWVQTDVTVASNGAKLGTLHVDPWVFGVGIGTKF